MTSSQTSGDVIDVLISGHRDVTALIGEIWSVTDEMIRRDLTDTVISELVCHSVAEEMYVYPVMRRRPECRALVAGHVGQSDCDAAMLGGDRPPRGEFSWLHRPELSRRGEQPRRPPRR
jgi:hypothetical protein